MPTIQFKGKNIIWNHHLSVPYHTLEEVEELHFQPAKSDGNIIVEGDNLIALKALLPEYAGEIKCIYIDPPYNTKKQTWVYNDNVNSPLISEWLGKTVDSNDLTRHDKWMCMITPRLKFLRDLLHEDGLIFISIDDNEYHNLKQLCDEIFGEECYVSTLIWNNDGHSDNQFHIKVNHEYVLVYIKEAIKIDSAIGYVVDPNTREESNLWKGYAENSITKNGNANPPSKVLLKKGFPTTVKDEKTLAKHIVPKAFYSEVSDKGFISREMTKRYNLKYPIRLNDMRLKDNALQEDCEVYTGWANVNKLQKFIDSGFKPVQEKDGSITFYLSENGVVYYRKEREQAKHIVSVLRNFGTTEQMKYSLEELGVNFDYPKPIELIKYILKIGGDKYSTVLDSFAGSGTTLQAVCELNEEDEGQRNCILIQMKENSDKEPDKNICKDITRKRNQKAIEKFKYNSGFKYFRVGTAIDPEKMLEGQLPTYEEFAKYVYYLATGEHLSDVKKIDPKNHFVGTHGPKNFYLIYEQDFDKLTRLALNLHIAEEMKKHATNKRMVVYAPACFLDSEYLEEKQIEFVSIPYNLFEKKEK